MTYTGQFAVSYALDALSAPEDVTGYVEQAQLTVGRKRIIDRWQPSELTVTLIDPTTTDPLVVGGFLVCKGIGFQIVSIARNYDIPYDAGTQYAPGDRVTIVGHSWGLYRAGRFKLQNEVLGIDDLQDHLLFAVGLTSGTPDADFIGSAWRTFTAKSSGFNGSKLDLMNSLTNAVIGYVHDPGQYDNLTGYNGMTFATTGSFGADNYINFTDGAAQSSANKQYHYDTLEFVTNSENDYDLITVTYNNGSSTVTKSSGASAYQELQTNTLLDTASQAQQTADMLYTLLAAEEIVPYAVSTKASIVSAYNLHTQTTYALPGSRVSVTFRGTTFDAVCEGFTITQTQSDARYTYYLSPALTVALILDDSAFGILDTNTLGIG
jgi:hypothetical protein